MKRAFRSFPGLCSLVVFLALAPASLAQQAADNQTVNDQAGNESGFGNSSEPFELSADQGIEWRGADKTYTARGNALAIQGKTSLAGDTLVFFTNGGGSSFDRILADGDVRISSAGSVAYGDHGDYQAASKLMQLTGTNLKIESASDVITSRDSLEYWTDRNVAVAKGQAVMTRKDSTVSADTITLYFRKNAAGDNELSQLEAAGRVKVDNGRQVASADHLAYDPDSQISVLTGNVKILDGGNEFRGARAEIDDKRKVSRLLAGESGRVHTFIKPKSASSGQSDTISGSQ